MPIVSVRDNESNRWKRNAKEKKNRTSRTEVKVEFRVSFVNYFKGKRIIDCGEVHVE